MPDIRTDDQHFYYFIKMLGQSEKLSIVENYFNTKSDLTPQEFLTHRAHIKNILTSKYLSLNAPAVLASKKYTYDKSLTFSRQLEDGEYCIVLDLKSAAYQVLYHYGLYAEKTWADYLSNYTDNELLLKYDDSLKYEIQGGLYNDMLMPPFSIAYKQLMYIALNSGLDDYMRQWPCKKIRYTLDAIYYSIESPECVDSFIKDWTPGTSRDYDGVSMHYRIGVTHYKNIVTEDDPHLPQRIYFFDTTYGDGGIPGACKNSIFPQYYKLCRGETVTEMDRYYLNGVVSPKIKLINE